MAIGPNLQYKRSGGRGITISFYGAYMMYVVGGLLHAIPGGGDFATSTASRFPKGVSKKMDTRVNVSYLIHYNCVADNPPSEGAECGTPVSEGSANSTGSRALSSTAR